MVLPRVKVDFGNCTVCCNLSGLHLGCSTPELYCYHLNRPTVDSTLVALDSLFGFNWLTWYELVSSNPTLKIIFAILYKLSLVLIIVAILTLDFSRRIAELRKMITTLILTSLLIVIISGLVPAECGWIYFAVETEKAYHLAHFNGLRDKSLKILALYQMIGIIIFPSFYAAIFLILTWSLRTLSIAFWIILILNIGIFLSIPTEGGHYLIDIVAGSTITIAIIWVINRQKYPYLSFNPKPVEAFSP